MCEYCENTNIGNNVIFGLYCYNGEWRISTDGADEEIFFCPKCGQELKKILENDIATTKK